MVGGEGGGWGEVVVVVVVVVVHGFALEGLRGHGLVDYVGGAGALGGGGGWRHGCFLGSIWHFSVRSI